MFSEIMGPRLAAELLLTDKVMTSEEALNSGFVTSILPDYPKGDNFDIKLAPSIPKLLKTDFKTLVNAKKLINAGRDRVRLVECLDRECKALLDAWADEEFLPKMANFMQSLAEKR
jgi:enoyl-CoA hydratase/carnithine racemase